MTSKMFFSSDQHFGHSNIIQFCNRPFSNSHFMNEGLIENWNKKVPKDGIVYIPGDISFLKPERTIEILQRLNGTKHLVLGNHDKNIRKKRELFAPYFASINDYLELGIQDPKNNKVQHCVLFHYPIQSWNRKHYGSWHLHGHVHSLEQKNLHQNMVDVGVDAWNYTPVSYQEINDILLKKD